MAFAAVTARLPRVAWCCTSRRLSGRQSMNHLRDDRREDDLKIGVKSSAILFADMDKALIFVMQAMMIFALVLAGRTCIRGVYYAGLTAAGLLFLYQQWLIRDRNPAGCLRPF